MKYGIVLMAGLLFSGVSIAEYSTGFVAINGVDSNVDTHEVSLKSEHSCGGSGAEARNYHLEGIEHFSRFLDIKSSHRMNANYKCINGRAIIIDYQYRE